VARAYRHESFGRETRYGLTNGTSAHAEFLGESGFAKFGSRRESLLADLFVKVLVDALPQGEIIESGLHSRHLS
jgi:hypothetical protein